MDWLAAAAGAGVQYEVVFSSYGAMHWIANLEAWAAGIAHLLAPGGWLTIVDFHPAERMFDRNWAHDGAYFPTVEERVDTHTEGVIDYVARTPGHLTPFDYQVGTEDFHNPIRCHTFVWTLGEMVTAIAGAGLCLEILREYPHTIAHRFDRMREIDHYRTLPPEDVPSVPLLYGLRARKG
jgi:hypothetical protein